MTALGEKASTVLTCGRLSLTIPTTAHMPKLNLRPGSDIIDITFSGFSGTLSFEAIDPISSVSQLPGSRTQSSTPPQSQNFQPTLEQSLQTSLIQPHVFSQPMSLPIPIPMPPTQPEPMTKVLPDHYLGNPNTAGIFDDYSPSQMPPSQLASQSLEQSASFQPSQLHAARMQASQMPESHPSQPDSEPPLPSTPPMPHFTSHSFVEIPSSPPSSRDSDQNALVIPPVINLGNPSPVPLITKIADPTEPVSHPSALACVDKRMAKHGKRVRFEENPTLLSSPPLKKLAVDRAISTPSSLRKSPKKKKKTPAPSFIEQHLGSPPESEALSQEDELSQPNSLSQSKILSQSKPLKHAKSPQKKSLSQPKSLQKNAVSHTKSQQKKSLSQAKTLSKSVGQKKPISPPKFLVKSPLLTGPQSCPVPKVAKKKKQDPVVACTEPSKITHSPIISPGQPCPWVAVEVPEAAMPLPRWGATFTPLDNSSVLLIGGESDASGFFRDSVVYDVKSSSWIGDGRRTPNMPSARAWHTATRIENVVFIFGGETGTERNPLASAEVDSQKDDDDDDRQQCNSAVVYDKTYRTWYEPSLTGTAPTARAGHCAALIPGTLNVVIYGGINGNKWLNDLHVLEDTCNWSKPRVSLKGARPAARSYATLTATSEFLVLFGGNNKTRCFNDVHLLLPDSMTWVEPVLLGRAPKPRTGHCAVPSKDGRSVIVYGGWDDQGAKRLFYSDVWVLRIDSRTECQWTCIYIGNNSSSTPGPRAGAAMCSGVGEEEDETMLFGGWYQVSHFNDITRLQVAANGRVRAPSR